MALDALNIFYETAIMIYLKKDVEKKDDMLWENH